MCRSATISFITYLSTSVIWYSSTPPRGCLLLLQLPPDSTLQSPVCFRVHLLHKTSSTCVHVQGAGWTQY